METDNEAFWKVASEYRKAFDEVQTLLGGLELGEMPPWVFAVDRIDVKRVAEIDVKLARAEQRRRQWRAALHAMAELTALQNMSGEAASVLDTFDPETLESSGIPGASPDGLPELDRFISVVQYARSAGCMYADGGFQPVFKGSS